MILLAILNMRGLIRLFWARLWVSFYDSNNGKKD